MTHMRTGLIKAAGNMILAFPESWDQKRWIAVPDESANECGTTYCLAGWVARLTGYVKSNGTLTKRGRKFATDGSYLTVDTNDNAGMLNNGWIALGAQALGLDAYQAEELFLAGAGSCSRQVDSPEQMMDAIFDVTGVRVNPPLADNFSESRGINVPFLRAIVGMIEAYPENWDQSNWSRTLCTESGDEDGETKSEKDEFGSLCGTAFCIAGWAGVLSGMVKLDGSPSKLLKGLARTQLAVVQAKDLDHSEDGTSLLKGMYRHTLDLLARGNRGGMDDDFWPVLGKNMLGVPSYVFDSGYGHHELFGLKSRLEADFGVTF